MGISKAYGMARANRYTGRAGPHRRDDRRRRACRKARSGSRCSRSPTRGWPRSSVFVDHNKLQSDSAVSAVSDLGPISKTKFRAFGWEVRRGDGHDFAVLRDTLAHFATVTDKPKVFIADTIKGKGVSFMEGLACGDQTYHFHAGAPSLKDYVAATREMVARINGTLDDAGPGRKVVLDLGAAAGARRRRSQAREDRAGLRRRAARAMARRPPRDCRDGRRPALGLRHRGFQGRIAGAVHRVRHCRACTWSRRRAAWRLRGMLPVVHSFACFLGDARQRAHLQQRHREEEDHLHGHARRPGARRPGSLAPVGSATSRPLARCRDWWRSSRAANGKRAWPFAGPSSRISRKHLPAIRATFRSIFRTRCPPTTSCTSAAA